jgi:glutathione S-transferase
MATFTLYGETLWISPYFFSSFVALREKGAPFDLVEVALFDGAHRQPDYSTPSVTGRIPSLEHAGFRLAESSAIAEYLEEALPPPANPRLFPQGLRERARARQIMAWLRSDLAALRDERSTITMFFRFELGPLGAQAQRDTDRLVRVAEQLIPAGEGPLFGDWSLADAELAFVLHRLILNGDAVPARVAEYARRQWERPSVRAFAEHARPAAVPPSYWVFSGTAEPKLARG